MVGNSLFLYRHARGFSQSQLAELCGVSRNSISSIERGNSIPSLSLAFRICDVLNVSISDVFYFRKEQP